MNIEFPWSQDLPHVDPVTRPAQFITPDDVLKSLRRMKNGKATGPSGVAAEMLKAAPDICCKIIADLMNAIILEGNVPADLSNSIIVSLFKGKVDALDRSNYRGLKLTDHFLKVIERVVENIIRETVNIDEMQFGFCPGRGTTDKIFILRQLQENYLAKHRKLYIAFVDLEKAFDRLPRKKLWWALRVVGIPEWLVKVVQAMYVGARSRTRVNLSFSEEFEVKVGVHQESVLSPLLFIIVLEALSREFRVGCPWEMLNADDLVILAEAFEGLMTKMAVWKNGLESKGLKVNMRKTKVMISGRDLHALQTSGKYPCAVCRKGVGKNSMFCSGCSFWVHQKCSNIPGRLVEDPDFRCRRCLGYARAIDGRPCVEVQLADGKPDVVDNFVYLGDCICPGGGCELATIKKCRSAWGKFTEPLALLTCKASSLNTRGQMHNSCVRGTMLYSSECWALRQEDKKRLERSERAMLLWLCNIKKEQCVSTNSLLSRLKLKSLDSVLRCNRLRWFGHMKRSELYTGQILDLEVEGNRGRGRPKKCWLGAIKDDLRQWNLQAETCQNRSEWRK